MNPGKKMPLKVIDSVGWIAYFMGDSLAGYYREHILRQSEVVCPSIIVYEVCKKIEQQINRLAAAMAVAQLAKTNVVPLNQSIATSAARVSIAYRLSMADAIIYTTALLAGATLVTSDAHFEILSQVEFIHSS
jgi:predicted nucleic acid-binding protein